MRKLRIGKKSIIALACTVALAVSGFGAYQVHATSKLVDTDAPVSLTVKVDDSVRTYCKADITVSIYQIGTVAVNGEYKTTDSLKGKIDFDDFSSTMTAAELKQFAENAKNALGDSDATASIVLGSEGTSAVFDSINQGVYIVTAIQGEPTVDCCKKYTFDSFVVAAPANYYGAVGSDGKNGDGEKVTSEDWIYDVVSTMKPAEEQLYNKLQINKKLLVNNVTKGKNDFFFNPSFVYEVTAEYEGQVVFNDVYAINYNENQSVVTEDIPCGAKVTVKEIYSGVTYEEVQEENNVTECTIKNTQDQNANSVDFTNTYNDKKLTGGVAITNTFSKAQTSIEPQ